MIDEGVREQAVTDYLVSGLSVGSICKKYGISNHSIYKWINDRRGHAKSRRIRNIRLTLDEAQLLFETLHNAAYTNDNEEAVSLTIQDRLLDIIDDLSCDGEI